MVREHFVGCPQLLEVRAVDAEDSRARTVFGGNEDQIADDDYNLSVLDQRRTGSAKEAFGNTEAPHGVFAPDLLTRRERDGVQLSLRTEGVHDIVGYHRRRSGPRVESEIVTIGGWICVSPLRVSCARIERLDDLLCGDTMKQDHAALRHHGPAESLPNLLLPDHARPARWPGLRQRRPKVDAIPLGTKELRPVADRALCERKYCRKQEATHMKLKYHREEIAYRHLFL